MRLWISPVSFPTLVPCVVEKAHVIRLQMAVIDEQLFDGFAVRMLRIAKGMSVAKQKWHRHIVAVEPELPCALGPISVPETTVAGSGVVIKAAPELLRGDFISILMSLFVEYDQKIGRQHIVERLNWLVQIA
jgi:hypothetical protein